MSIIRIALANIRLPQNAEESVQLASSAIAEAAERGAEIICFPECYVPGYRWPGSTMPEPDEQFLASAVQTIAHAARDSSISVVLGTERITDGGLQISAVVIDKDGEILGWQDKGQLDPQEEETYPAKGSHRHVFTIGTLTFGIVICHEGFRYPETVRWAAQHGAQVVFHPHAHIAEEGSFRPTTFADPNNTFHEKAMMCRAAENTCFFVSVNGASAGSGTTSAVIRPDGTVQCYQPYGQSGVLVADINLTEATGFLASRCRTWGT